MDPETTVTEVESCIICGVFRWTEDIIEGIKTTGGTFLGDSSYLIRARSQGSIM